jgi:hypothetical protein
MILDTGDTLDARDVTWIEPQKDPDDLYVESINKAVKSKNPKDISQHAAYAAAIATSGNQKIEATKIQARADLSKKDPKDALLAFSKAAEAPNFTKADEKKQKAFVGEWFDTIEKAAKSEGAAPDKNTGLVLSSVPRNSEIPQQLEKLSKTLAKVDPGFSAEAARQVPGQSQALGSDLSAKENVVRSALSRGPTNVRND